MDNISALAVIFNHCSTWDISGWSRKNSDMAVYSDQAGAKPLAYVTSSEGNARTYGADHDLGMIWKLGPDRYMATASDLQTHESPRPLPVRQNKAGLFVPTFTNWRKLTEDDFMGGVDISDRYTVNVSLSHDDSSSLFVAYADMADRDVGEFLPIWESPDKRIVVVSLQYDDPRDVGVFVDGNAAGVYVSGMAWVHEGFRGVGAGRAMITCGTAVANRPPSMELDGEYAGVIGYSEAGYNAHVSALRVLASDQARKVSLSSALSHQAGAGDHLIAELAAMPPKVLPWAALADEAVQEPVRPSLAPAR